MGIMRPMKGITMSNELSINEKATCIVAGLATGISIFAAHELKKKIFKTWH